MTIMVEKEDARIQDELSKWRDLHAACRGVSR